MLNKYIFFQGSVNVIFSKERVNYEIMQRRYLKFCFDYMRQRKNSEKRTSVMSGAIVNDTQCLTTIKSYVSQVLQNIKPQVFVSKMLTSTAKDFCFLSLILRWGEVAHSSGFQGDSVLLTDRRHIVLPALEILWLQERGDNFFSYIQSLLSGMNFVENTLECFMMLSSHAVN